MMKTYEVKVTRTVLVIAKSEEGAKELASVGDWEVISARKV